MNGKYLLDTNIIIALFANDKDVIKELKNNTDIAIPSIVIGELFYGVYNLTKQEENIAKVFKLISKSKIISCDEITANNYGQIKKLLKTQGNPIPENDIWIAGIVQQHDMTLVTRDKHFEKIKSINVVKW